MLGITHVAIGASFGVLVATTTDEPLTLSEWGFLLIGSLAPDLDQGNALISRPGSLLFRFLPRGPRVFLDVIGLAVSKLLSTLFGHRNFIHWPVLGMSFIGCGILSGLHPLIWFGWGYLLHIVADACTRGGCPAAGSLQPKTFLPHSAADGLLAGVRPRGRSLGLYRRRGLWPLAADHPGVAGALREPAYALTA